MPYGEKKTDLKFKDNNVPINAYSLIGFAKEFSDETIMGRDNSVLGKEIGKLG